MTDAKASPRTFRPSGPSGLANRNQATDAHERGRMPAPYIYIYGVCRLKDGMMDASQILKCCI